MAPWCGKMGTGWLVAGTLNPCAFNTAAAAVLVAAVGASAALQGASARRLAAAASGRSYLLPRTGGVVHAGATGSVRCAAGASRLCAPVGDHASAAAALC